MRQRTQTCTFARLRPRDHCRCQVETES
jgi:hypothetical protein